MVNDRVGDFIVRLQNAALIKRRDVSAPYSAHLEAIAKKLKQLGFLERVEKQEKEGSQPAILATLAFDERGMPRLRGVKRISKPGRRLYVPHTDANRVKGGTGARLISTSRGILSDAEVRRDRVGGENMFEIW